MDETINKIYKLSLLLEGFIAIKGILLLELYLVILNFIAFFSRIAKILRLVILVIRGFNSLTLISFSMGLLVYGLVFVAAALGLRDLDFFGSFYLLIKVIMGP